MLCTTLKRSKIKEDGIYIRREMQTDVVKHLLCKCSLKTLHVYFQAKDTFVLKDNPQREYVNKVQLNIIINSV